MKKTIFTAAVALLALSACKKDYTCECVEKETSPSGTINSTSTFVIHDTQSNATKACDNGDASSSSGQYSSSVECNIK